MFIGYIYDLIEYEFLVFLVSFSSFRVFLIRIQKKSFHPCIYVQSCKIIFLFLVNNNNDTERLMLVHCVTVQSLAFDGF